MIHREKCLPLYMIWILVDLSRHGWIHCDQHYQEKNIQFKEHTLLRLLNISNSQTEVTKMRVDATFIDQLFYRAKKAPNCMNIYLVFHGIITLRKALLLWR